MSTSTILFIGSENMCHMLKIPILADSHSSETFKCFRRILLKQLLSSETISSETLAFLLKHVCHIGVQSTNRNWILLRHLDFFSNIWTSSETCASETFSSETFDHFLKQSNVSEEIF
jgi:hypothetical protein